MVYVPKIPTNITDVETLRKTLEVEIQKLVESLPEMDEAIFTISYAQPQKPRDGMVVYADGTSWNPGAGAGLYERRGGSWFKL